MAYWIAAIFLISTLIQLGYWVFLFSKVAFYRQQSSADGASSMPHDGVSVIICARNEAENLQELLPILARQNYPEYEVIVVNDNSSDKTSEIIWNFVEKSSNFRLVNLSGYQTLPGKKGALTQGILASRYEILLLTDADCRPVSDNWIRSMAGVLQRGKSIGLGFSPYFSQKGLLNLFIRFETIYTAIQYFSLALIGLPYMGVGRNLIYRKQLFAEAGGFQKHKHIASGDDDLFVNSIATASNTAINLDKDSFVYSIPKGTLRGYYRQKSRHLSTSTTYRPQHQLVLGLLSASHFGHYAGLLACWTMGYPGTIIWFLYLARILVVMFVNRFTLQKLDQGSIFPWTPLLDALYIAYYLVFAPILIIGKRDQWI